MSKRYRLRIDINATIAKIKHNEDDLPTRKLSINSGKMRIERFQNQGIEIAMLQVTIKQCQYATFHTTVATRVHLYHW